MWCQMTEVSSSKSRELTETEKQILLLDLGNLYEMEPSHWESTLEFIESTTFLLVSTVVTIAVTGSLAPRYLALAVAGLVILVSGFYSFLAFRIGMVCWVETWKDELAERLGAWKEPSLSWMHKTRRSSKWLKYMGRFYALGYDEWWMHADGPHVVLTIALGIFGILTGGLLTTYLTLTTNLGLWQCELVGALLAIGWVMGMRSLTTVQIHTFTTSVKERVRRQVGL